MLPPQAIKDIEEVIGSLAGLPAKILSVTAAGGGCINQCYVIRTNNDSFFIKVNEYGKYPDLFEKECLGLKELIDTHTIKLPRPYHYSNSGNITFLLMEYIEPAASRKDFWEFFGTSMASLHRHSSEYCGLDYDNYIGSLVQRNFKHTDWISFFINERLEPQISLAMDQHKADRNVMRSFSDLFNRCYDLIPTENASLLHGDFWNGNYIISSDGSPCLIDPAIYYGSREMDIAMSKLFGGFPASFYESYNHAFPLVYGWESRIDLYNLYPLMVHVNLFGGSYLESVKQILRRYL